MKKNKIIYVAFLVSLVINLLILIKFAVSKYYFSNKKQIPEVSNQSNQNNSQIFEQINPIEGYEINATFGNLGPEMIRSGVIDVEKFKSTYVKSNQPLTSEQEEILTIGSDKKIKIDRDNSYFLLNFFWAVGLNNKSKILSDGDMVKYDGIKGAGNFASTGGWSLANGNAMDFYSKDVLIPLTQQQESLVEEVSSNIFRPCCNNSTAFPDCNHGMALLGVLQLMAASGANEDQLYDAGKYFNAYWFPGNYFDLATYFKNTEGEDFSDIDAKKILGTEYSSATGSQNIKKWLSDQGLTEEPPKSGGGCGV